ncbi:hypothetical protein ACFL6Y_02585 [Elusimicrobiota bacterium]
MAEKLTLTSYYPSPYGTYQELRSTQGSYLATNSGNVGIGTMTPNPDSSVKLDVQGNAIVSGSVGIGTTVSPSYQLNVGGDINSINYYKDGIPFSEGPWAQSGSDIYYAGGKVGIGTAVPGKKLDVNGNIHASGRLSGAVMITHSDLYESNKTNDWTNITATKWHICYFAEILHNDKKENSDFEKRLRPKSGTKDSKGRFIWEVKITGNNERAGSNVRCYNIGI